MGQTKTSILDLKNFINLNKGSLCYLSGDEDFFIDEGLDLIKKKKLQDSCQDFNFDTFYGREVEATKVSDVIETLPMLSDQRLVIWKQAHELWDMDWERLMPVLTNPPPSSFVVFVGNKLDSRKKLMKQVLENLTPFHFSKPYDRDFPKWVQYICKKHQQKIEEDAIQLLIQIVGSNLLEIKNEVLKLGHYVGPDRSITAADVMTVASRIRLKDIFELTDAIGKGDQARALMCLADLMGEGQTAVSILAMVHRHIRLLRQTKLGEQQGYYGRDLSSFAGVPHYFLKEYSSQASLWNERKIEKTYRLLSDTDRALKSSPISTHIWLENFVMQTCQ